MKYYLNMLIALSVVMFFGSCEEETVGQQPVDSTPPGKIMNVRHRTIAGGAVFHYSLPEDEDLLCVKAVYSLDGTTEMEVKASAFIDSLVVRGFGDMMPHEVKLISVDKSRNESEPHIETITPLKPDILTISESLNIMSDFGGLFAGWENPNQAEIAIHVEVEDHNNEYVPEETFYSSSANGKGSIRGLSDTITYNFRTYIVDHWGNKGPTRYDTIVPLYETQFDRLKFARIMTPGDITAVAGFEIERIWDLNLDGDPPFSSPAGTGIWPHAISFDMGVVGKISRIRLYQRSAYAPYIFAEGNMRNFEVWGCVNFNPGLSGWDQWTLLMDCESIKPSGLPVGQVSMEDEQVARNGEDFVNDPNNPPVRYIRILCKRTWSGGSNFQIGELEIFGDNRPSVQQQ